MTDPQIAVPKPFNTTTDNLERLCRFFACPIEALVEYVPDSSKMPRE
jgi:DNA-binding Xre family transcriptional regulator